MPHFLINAGVGASAAERMPSPPDPDKLLAELQALRAERDAAVNALDRVEGEAADQQKLLIEEQDRFVSRLLKSHEREVLRLRLELDEARMSAQRYEQKMEKERARTVRLEDDLLRVRGDADKIRDQRDAFRTELRKAHQVVLNLQAANERLEADLKLAKSMLGDAIGNAAPGMWESAKPPTKQHEISRPPRESGIQNRRERPSRARVSTPPGRSRSSNPPRRSEAPRAAVGDPDKPPSSR
jgi:hypothetical protein